MNEEQGEKELLKGGIVNEGSLNKSNVVKEDGDETL